MNASHCSFRASDAIFTNEWQIFPCACCLKFCGGVDLLTCGQCELQQGKCRVRPVSLSNGGLHPLLVLIAIPIAVSAILLVLLRLLSIKSEQNFIRSLANGGDSAIGRSRLPELLAIVLGILCGVIPIPLMMMLVRYWRRRGQALMGEFNPKQSRKKN